MTQPLSIVFAGTPDFAAISLKAMLDAGHKVIAVYCQPDRPSGRGKKLAHGPVKKLALEHEIPVYQPKSLRNEEAQAELAALNADLMVVAAYGLILPQVVLDTPKHGCINVHGSLFLLLRGAAPIHRAILAGDKVTGITTMQMSLGLDTGDMLDVLQTEISPQDTGASLHDRMAVMGGECLLVTLEKLKNGQMQPQVQDDSLANYANKLTKEEAQLDWNQSAAELERTVRAFNSWPVAFTKLDDLTVRIWQASVVETTSSEKPGSIISADKSGLTVACAENALQLEVLQLPGKKALSVDDILRGRADTFTIGAQFAEVVVPGVSS